MRWSPRASTAVAGLTTALALTVAVAPGARAAAPDQPPAGLVTALHHMVAAGYPGVVAYAARDGRRWQRADGVADQVTRRPARAGDRFRIFSNTKAFVSTVILQLASEQRLDLDDTVERWLPGMIHGAGNDGTRITIRQLLNNTSGIYDPTNDPAFATDRGGHTPAEVLAAAMAHPPLFPPGTAWNYSNTNYILAGMVIQAVTHHRPDTEIAWRILTPLRLTHTSFPISDPTIAGPHLHGYDLSHHDVTRFTPSGEWTAGAMISTVDDLARFHRALFTGALLPPAQQRDLLTTVPTDDASVGYGLGVQSMPVPCPTGPVTVWETDGGGAGYISTAVTTNDGARQLVLAANIFDLARDQHHQPPIPDAGSAPLDAMTSAICTP